MGSARRRRVRVSRDSPACALQRMLLPSLMASSTAIKLAAPPSGWFDYRYYLLSDGSLGILRTDRDINSDHQAWWKRVQSGEHHEPMPDLWTGLARLSVLTPEGENAPVSVPLIRHPEIDRFADGRWIIVSARAKAKQANATVLNVDGRASHSFAVGDGVEHVRCAPDGTVWVGYFDEGIFGETLGAGGIVRFANNGQPLWSYNGRGRGGASFIDDCYALTLNGNELWSCFYSDFPIVCIVDGKETSWRNAVTGAKALAVDGDHILLAGGYALEQSRLSLLKLTGAEATLLGSYRNPAMNDAALMHGRSDTIHIISSGTWSRVSVADARAALKVG